VTEVAAAVGDRVPVVVGDRVDVQLAARLLGAAVLGAHVGQSDLPIAHIRGLVREDALQWCLPSARLRIRGRSMRLIDGNGIMPPAARITRVLSIAGTDPTAGAGIQADLDRIAANGGYGMAVVTALVAQNTRGVRLCARATTIDSPSATGGCVR